MELLEQGYEQTHSLGNDSVFVYDIAKDADGIIYLIKTDNNNPEVHGQVALNYEFDLYRKLSGAHFLKVAQRGFSDSGAWISFQLDDHKAHWFTLRQLLSDTLNLSDKFKWALALCDALKSLHSQGYIHNYLSPDKILCTQNQESSRVLFSDLSSCARVNTNESFSSLKILSTQRYFSPEQTGKYHHNVDYRTDFYNLGLIFFELFTGVFPYKATSLRQLFHAHIAHEPDFSLLSQISPAMGQITHRLLNKDPDLRYYSIHSLIEDLNSAQNNPAGSLSFSHDEELGKLRPINNLYGRDNEIAHLDQLARSAQEGRFSVVLVDGISGVGKSSLVQQLHIPVSKYSGHMISGKYDQFGSDVPMVAFIQAFEGIIQQVEHDSTEQRELWLSHLRSELGEHWGLLTHVLPNLRQFFDGFVDNEVDTDSAEYQFRFVEACKAFIRAACKTNPLIVLFLDDVQWIDPLSINLLQGIEQDNHIENLLLVCAYRDNEMDSLHPFYRFVESISGKSEVVTHISVKPLKLDSTCALIAYTLQMDESDVMDLANLVQQRSLGNPFYIKQLLSTLVDKHWLYFDGMLHKWVWEKHLIQNDQSSEDIVELMINRLKQLSDESQTLIRVAAAIGNQFDIAMLRKIYGGDTSSFIELFKEILSYDFLYSNHAAKQLLVEEHTFNEFLSSFGYLTFRFVHDRVQQAAYRLEDESKNKDLHLSIGLALADSLGRDESDDLFQIVNQINQALDIVPEEKRIRFARLNVEAGLKAKKSAAFDASRNYFQAAMHLIGEDGWTNYNSLTYDAHFQYLQTLYLLTEFEQAQKVVEQILPFCDEVERKVAVYITQMLILIGANQMGQAVELAIEVLRELGFELEDTPLKDYPPVLNDEMDAVFDKLEQLPTMTNKKALFGIHVLIISGSSSFFSDHDTFMKIAYTMFKLTVEHGNGPSSPYAYALYAQVCNDLKMYRVGYRYCEMALRLIERDNNVELLPQVIEIFNVHMRHYCDPIRDCLPDIANGAIIGRDIGGIEFASINAAFHGPYALFAGLDLHEVQSSLVKHHSLLRKFGQKFCLTYQGICQGLVSSLCLEQNDDMIASGEFDEQFDLTVMLAENNQTCLSLYYLSKTLLNTFLQNYEAACHYSKLAHPLVDSVFGMRNSVEILFYHTFVHLKWQAQTGALISEEQEQSYQDIAQQFEMWVDLCAENNESKFLMLQGAYAMGQAKFGIAMKLFHKAAQMAKQYKNWLDMSLAQISLIEIQVALTDEALASSFVSNCLETLKSWGAHAIGANLIQHYPIAAKESQIHMDHGVLVRKFDTQHSLHQQIELESLVDTLQIIANEIDRTQLSRKILDVLVSSTNATSGAFFSILENQEKPELLAIHQNQATHVARKGQAINLSQSILEEVIDSGAKLVIADGLTDERFRHDAHVRSSGVRSLLCAPMYRADSLIGIIYLENNLVANLFNAERLKFIDLLIKQSVSALVNAQLYTLLVQEIEEKTAAESSLADLNKNLESIVEQRTEALMCANKELEESISELKDTQNKLVQSEKMASLGALVAGVAHEINTPIGSALGASSFLVSEVESIHKKYKSGGLTQRDFEHLLNASQESMQIVNGNLLRAGELIRSFKRVAVDQSHEHVQKFDLVEACHDVVASLKPKYKHMNIRFDWLGEPSLIINQNPGAIGQIITNLVMNSIHHGFEQNEEGVVTIETIKQGEQVVLRYSDNGIGMTDEVKARIFEPFFTTKRGLGGSGLGMHIVFNLVTQKLKGDIHLKKQSQGASFEIKFPLM